MSKYTPIEIQEMVKKDFNNSVSLGLTGVSLKSIRKDLGLKYDLAYSTVYKITTNGYKLKEVKEALEARKEDKTSTTNSVATDFKKKYKVRFNKSNPKTMIFVGWEIRTGLTKEFLNLLDQMSAYYNAEVYVTPLWMPDLEFLPPELSKYNILIENLEINKNLKFKYVPTHALSMSPLQGWAGAHEKSVIFPGLIKELQTEKSLHLCKQIMTTGSIGKLNAIWNNYGHITDDELRDKFNKRWGMVQARRGGRTYEIAKEFTLPSLLIVDIKDDQTFFTRYVTMKNLGTIYDRNLKFTAFKETPEISRPEAHVIADIHCKYVDHQKMNATFQMHDEWKPKCSILNDFVDFQSANDHESHDFAKVLQFPTLEEEGDEAKLYLDEICDHSENVFYLQSNHDNFLVRFLAREENYKIGRNYKKALELRLWQIQNPHRHPVEKLLDLDSKKKVKFVPEREFLNIKGTIVAHGHEGISGRRVGFRALQKVYNNYCQGHTHSPEVYRNGVCTGTSSKLDMDYKIGADAWMHADALIQPDGTTQLIPIIYGEYRI